MIAAVRSDVSVNEPVLYVAFELATKEWKLAMTFPAKNMFSRKASPQSLRSSSAGSARRLGLVLAWTLVSLPSASAADVVTFTSDTISSGTTYPA